MRVEGTIVVHLTERDIRMAAPDGGLTVDLPPGTTKVIIKVERDGDKEKEG